MHDPRRALSKVDSGLPCAVSHRCLAQIIHDLRHDLIASLWAHHVSWRLLPAVHVPVHIAVHVPIQIHTTTSIHHEVLWIHCVRRHRVDRYKDGVTARQPASVAEPFLIQSCRIWSLRWRLPICSRKATEKQVECRRSKIVVGPRKDIFINLY